MEFKQITFSREYLEKYWEGPANIFSRYYNYLQRGFGFVNEAKNYFLIIFGSIWTVKYIEILGYKINSNWIIIAGIIGIPLLIIAGRWDLYRLSKAKEFSNIHLGSVTGYDSYNMQVRTIELLEEILKELKGKEDNIAE